MNRNSVTRSGPRWAAAAVASVLLAGLSTGASTAAPAGPGEGQATAAEAGKGHPSKGHPGKGQPLGEDGTWAASADRTDATLVDQTVRNIVRTNIGGSDLRISLSNVFGSEAVTFGSATVGGHEGGGSVTPGSNRQVTFGGSPSITVPAGAEVLSDPLPGRVEAQQDLAVSVYVQGNPGTVTGHNLARQTSYVSTPGDHATDESAADFPTAVSNWYWLDGIVVSTPKRTPTVAALGDSITDGFGSTSSANNRWPDVLAERLLEGAPRRTAGVINEGISGNKVLSDGSGVSALARLDRDVLAQPGVETVILLEGINDISGGATADEVIAGYRQLIARSHAEGTCILGGTLTAFETAGAEREAERVAVNEFIRTSGEFDAVIDFDAATRDPADPDGLLPAFDSGDNLHPSDAGYQAMGEAVPLAELDCKR